MVSFFFSFLYAALFATRRQLHKPDLIVGSSVHLLAPASTWCLARWWGLPVLTEIRDIWPAALVHLGFPRYHPLILIFGAIEKFLYRYSDAVITLLPASIDHFVSLGCPRERIYWVPNGTAMELSPQEALDQPFRAMYLGTFGIGYCLETLIHAAAILEKENANITIVLKGHGPHRDVLENLIEELGVTQVRFEPGIPKTEVRAALGASDALIFHLPPSPVFRWGISSNKLFDYLASGRPVVFACNAANNPVELSGAGLTITPESPEELAEALKKLAALSQEERLEMGQRGQTFIAENHAIPMLAKKFEHAVEDTMRRLGHSGAS